MGDTSDKLGIPSSLGVITGILSRSCFVFERFFGLLSLSMDEALIITGFFEETNEVADGVGETKNDDKPELA